VDWIGALGDIKYLGVIVAALASFALGFTWYHWSVFGARWAGLLGMSKEEADSTDGIAYALGVAVVGSVVAAACLAALMLATGTEGFGEGALFGAVSGVALRVTSLTYHYAFARSPRQLAVIDGMHDIVQLALMGALIGVI
jgi:hypothetical protein